MSGLDGERRYSPQAMRRREALRVAAATGQLRRAMRAMLVATVRAWQADLDQEAREAVRTARQRGYELTQRDRDLVDCPGCPQPVWPGTLVVTPTGLVLAAPDPNGRAQTAKRRDARPLVHWCPR